MLGLALSVLLGGAGCSTTPAAKPSGDTNASVQARSAPTKSQHEKAINELKKDMTAAEVRTAWGEPDKITPMESPEGQAEVWRYVKTYGGGVRQVQTSQTSYERQNPITGAMETLYEPVYSTEHVLVEETIELLLFNGRLVSWKRTARTDRSYN